MTNTATGTLNLEGAGTAIQLCGVSRVFAGKRALDDVSLEVPAGSVVGLVGENGAGKTTIIKHVLGLLKAEAGSVRVFGQDPTKSPADVLSRIGYLSEEPELPGWMRVHELLRYVAAFYPTWDQAYAEALVKELALDPTKKVEALSKGQRARAGLVAALAYRPELLVLDEPSSGLDPVVRRDILAAIVRTVADQGRTVLFSSHLLSEVERVADRVAMIRGGRILFSDSLDGIKESHARLTLRFATRRSAPPPIDGALRWDGSGQDWSLVCAGDPERLEVRIRAIGAEILDRPPLSLDDIFLAHAAVPSGPKASPTAEVHR